MPKKGLNVSLQSYDDIFSTEETRQDAQLEKVQQIPLGELHPFKNHPFKVIDDEAMLRTVESIAQFGVLSPAIARPRPEGGYELVSGHRRHHAAAQAGLDTMPVIVRDLDDDAAVCLMVVFFATPKYLKMQNAFPKVATGNSSFLHVSPA